ncbi:MAG: IS110 family transposase [Longimicrobiales bacterium]
MLNPNAAGIDLGSRSHYVSVPEGRDTRPVRHFGCYTAQLQEMAIWLKSCQIETIAMEATGVYWIPVFEVLESHGFKVLLVDARQVKNLKGRKSDVVDCQWIRHLHSYGLLNAAFRPRAEICQMRAYWRQRSGLVESASRQIQLMQKALEQMNVQLHKAVSDITGKTGISIIRAIVQGERDPHTLAKMRHTRLKASREELAQALTGNYRQEHLFALAQALEGYDFIHQQIENCDRRLETFMKTLPGKALGAATKNPRQARRKNQPHFDLRAEQIRIAGVDLTRIPAIDTLTAQVVLTEVGVDVSSFPKEGNFASWATVCPNNQITGGKVRSRRTRKSAHPLAASLRVAAQTLSRSKTPLGVLYRRLRARIGAPKAITALAHKLARIIYRMLKYGEEYVEEGHKAAEKQIRNRSLKSLTRMANELGYGLILRETGEILD